MRVVRASLVLVSLSLFGCGPTLETVDPPARPVVQAPQTQSPQTQPPPTNVQQTAVPFTGGTFNARFVDKSTQQPIAGLQVTINGETQVTTSDGTVTFQNIPAGARMKTYHNDYVQLDQAVPGTTGTGPTTVPVTNMKELI